MIIYATPATQEKLRQFVDCFGDSFVDPLDDVASLTQLFKARWAPWVVPVLALVLVTVRWQRRRRFCGHPMCCVSPRAVGHVACFLMSISTIRGVLLEISCLFPRRWTATRSTCRCRAAKL